MRVLIRTISMLSLVLSVVLAAIIGLTYRDTSRFTYLFLRPDGSKCQTPCLLGVDLEKMAFEEADQNIHNHPFFALSRLNTMFRYLDEYTGAATYENVTMAQVEINFYAGNLLADYGYVDKSYNEVAARFYKNAPTLSDLMLALGKPDGLYMMSDGKTISCSPLYFIKGKILYTVFVNRNFVDCFHPAQTIEVIYLNMYKSSYDMLPWIGFAPYQRYLAEYQPRP